MAAVAARRPTWRSVAGERALVAHGPAVYGQDKTGPPDGPQRKRQRVTPESGTEAVICRPRGGLASLGHCSPGELRDRPDITAGRTGSRVTPPAQAESGSFPPWAHTPVRPPCGSRPRFRHNCLFTLCAALAHSWLGCQRLDVGQTAATAIFHQPDHQEEIYGSGQICVGAIEEVRAPVLQGSEPVEFRVNCSA